MYHYAAYEPIKRFPTYSPVDDGTHVLVEDIDSAMPYFMERRRNLTLPRFTFELQDATKIRKTDIINTILTVRSIQPEHPNGTITDAQRKILQAFRGLNVLTDMEDHVWLGLLQGQVMSIYSKHHLKSRRILILEEKFI
jgi:hypothetical protein